MTKTSTLFLPQEEPFSGATLIIHFYYSADMSETSLLPGQDLSHLLPPSWKADVQRWLAEDTPSFDWAGFVVGEEDQEAILWGKSGVSCRSLPTDFSSL